MKADKRKKYNQIASIIMAFIIATAWSFSVQQFSHATENGIQETAEKSEPADLSGESTPEENAEEAGEEKAPEEEGASVSV